MARRRLTPIEPDDLPSLEAEAIAIFKIYEWGEDSQWLGSLALSVFRYADGPELRPVLGMCAQHNIKAVARSKRDAGQHASRDLSLLLAFARLCGCEDKNANLLNCASREIGTSSTSCDVAYAEERRRIATEFRANRAHAQGADFESALVTLGWPEGYESDATPHSALIMLAQAMIGSRAFEPFDSFPALVRLMHHLYYFANLDLLRVIDDGAVAAAGSIRWGPHPRAAIQPRVPPPRSFEPDSLLNARSLSNWIMVLGPHAVEVYFERFRDCQSDEQAGEMALGVRDAIEKWLSRAAGHPTYVRNGGQSLAEATYPYFELLRQRFASNRSSSWPSVRRAWLWFALCTFEADPARWDESDQTLRDEVLHAANEDISRLRKLLARAQPKPLVGHERELMVKFLHHRGATLPELTESDLCQGNGTLLSAETDAPTEQKQRTPWEEFEWESDHIQTCLSLLYRFGGVWQGLKPMLLAWRALATPAVAHDLRYWPESGLEPPPRPWSDLVAWPINLFHVFVGQEQSTDPQLVKLRGDLASFCLERLADRWSKAEREQAVSQGRTRTNDDMQERSPEWRYCLIRAADSLGINPEGKGHRILKMSAELDPEADVRDAAKKAFESIRRNIGLPEGVSPRRAIMSALWWIRQAHLLGLEIQPDRDGAQRTRVKELSRTKESERAE